MGKKWRFALDNEGERLASEATEEEKDQQKWGGEKGRGARMTENRRHSSVGEKSGFLTIKWTTWFDPSMITTDTEWIDLPLLLSAISLCVSAEDIEIAKSTSNSWCKHLCESLHRTERYPFQADVQIKTWICALLFAMLLNNNSYYEWIRIHILQSNWIVRKNGKTDGDWKIGLHKSHTQKRENMWKWNADKKMSEQITG